MTARKPRIVATPDILSGTPRIDGSRMAVDMVVEIVAAHLEPGGIDCLLADYDHLTRDDLRAALEFAAKVVTRYGLAYHQERAMRRRVRRLWR